jgi:hypothetical protein
MNAIIIWLGNNAVASTLFSAVCAFLMLTGVIFWVLFFYDRWVNVVRIKKNYFVKRDEK